MKCTIHFDKGREEEVIVYTHASSPLTEEIRRICDTETEELIGYGENDVRKLHPRDVCCFVVENNKIWALTMEGKYQIKARLYQLEERLSDGFVKIHQSCLANVRRIEKFGTSFTGALTVTFQNGYCDYVSRRNVKHIKERFGL